MMIYNPAPRIDHVSPNDDYCPACPLANGTTIRCDDCPVRNGLLLPELLSCEHVIPDAIVFDMRLWGSITAIVLAISATFGLVVQIDAEPLVPAAQTHGFDAEQADRDATAALMRGYDFGGASDGRFGSSWWTTAISIDAVIEFERATGDRSYVRDIRHTFTADAHYGDGSAQTIAFSNHYADDTLWWGVTWLHGYQLIGDRSMLAAAERIADWSQQFWTGECGGGVRWGMSILAAGSQKNAITNALYLRLNAELAAVTGRADYRNQARSEAAWLLGRLVRRDGTLADHLAPDCSKVGGYLTYSHGVAVAGLAALGDVRDARRLADTAVRRQGVVRESCEPRCVNDGEVYKGALVEGVGVLNAELPGCPYSRWLLANAESAYLHDRDAANEYGLSWAGPPDKASPTRQTAAVELLTAVVRQR